MHQCTHCQAELPDHAQFCSYCGMPVPFDQTESSNDTNIDGERPEDTPRAEQGKSQSPEALVDSAAQAEEPPLPEEDQSSEVTQQPGKIATEEDAGAVDCEESPTNEAAGTGEELAEDIPEPATP